MIFKTHTLSGAVLLVGLMASSQVLMANADTDTLTTGADEPSMSSEHSGLAAMPMQQNMHQMQKQMTQISETEDPVERQKLQQAHMAGMRNMMNMMHGMMGMMASQGMGGGGKNAPCGTNRSDMDGTSMMTPSSDRSEMMGSSFRNNPMMHRMMMLEERINAMQLLLEQVIDSQAALLNGTQ